MYSLVVTAFQADMDRPASENIDVEIQMQGVVLLVLGTRDNMRR